jgi:hypothetical protein
MASVITRGGSCRTGRGQLAAPLGTRSGRRRPRGTGDRDDERRQQLEARRRWMVEVGESAGGVAGVDEPATTSATKTRRPSPHHRPQASRGVDCRRLPRHRGHTARLGRDEDGVHESGTAQRRGRDAAQGALHTDADRRMQSANHFITEQERVYARSHVEQPRSRMKPHASLRGRRARQAGSGGRMR